MLMLLFHLSDNCYAITVSDIVEVTPRVQLDSIPLAEDYLGGLFSYHGQNIPVIDLCQLMLGRPCRDSLTTRIILVRFPLTNGGTRLLGLLAERITDTIELPADAFTNTGIHIDDAPYLGAAARTERGLLQQVNTSELIPSDVQDHLFSGANPDAIAID